MKVVKYAVLFSFVSAMPYEKFARSTEALPTALARLAVHQKITVKPCLHKAVFA